MTPSAPMPPLMSESIVSPRLMTAAQSVGMRATRMTAVADL